VALSRSVIKGAVASAFKVLGDIPEAATYRRTSSTYNPATGTNVVTNSDTTIPDVVFTKFQNFEVDKITILSTDIKAIFQSSRIAVVPNIATDVLVDKNSKVFNIIRVEQDPAGATYSLQLRAP
jgi:hypothetical protein